MIADMSLNATSWRRRRRFTTSLRPSQSSLHAPFLKCGLFACSALNARSNDCHVGLLCMTQRAQYRTQMWVRTLCVVVRTDFLCYPLHFQHKKLNSPWRCSRVPVRADPLRVACSRRCDRDVSDRVLCGIVLSRPVSSCLVLSYIYINRILQMSCRALILFL